MVFPFQWNRFRYFLLQALAVHPWVASKFQFIARENPYTKPTKNMGIFHVGHLETHPSDHRQSFLLGLLPHPHPPQKKKTWHNISAYFSHWAPKHVSFWSFCRLACLDTLAVSGRSQILVHDSDRLISFETSVSVLDQDNWTNNELVAKSRVVLWMCLVNQSSTPRSTRINPLNCLGVLPT